MARVLLVGRGAPERGGIPTFLEQLSQGVEGHDVALLNLADTTKEGGRLSGRNLARTFRDLRRVWAAARGADIVHIHSALLASPTMLRAGAFAATARARGAKTIVHAHGGALIERLTPTTRAILRLALTPADAVVTVSEVLHDALTSTLPAGKLRHVRNGVETDRFHPVATRPDDDPVVLFVGGLTPRKGVLGLIAASLQLLEGGVPHRLMLVGGVPDEGGSAFDAVRAAAVHPHIHLTGAVARDDLPDIYRAADVFCLPSWWEAAPLSVLEAMATGLPVVATRVGDIPQMLDGGAVGILVDPRATDQLARALERLLRDPAERRRLGEAARLRATASASLDGTRASLAQLYTEVGNRR